MCLFMSLHFMSSQLWDFQPGFSESYLNLRHAAAQPHASLLTLVDTMLSNCYNIRVRIPQHTFYRRQSWNILTTAKPSRPQSLITLAREEGGKENIATIQEVGKKRTKQTEYDFMAADHDIQSFASSRSGSAAPDPNPNKFNQPFTVLVAIP